jgi:hypothetical protein
MNTLFAGGHIVDIVLMFTLIEWILLARRYITTQKGLAPVPLALALLPGVCLMLAVRCALLQTWWGWTALCLLAALPAHLADLKLRRAV